MNLNKIEYEEKMIEGVLCSKFKKEDEFKPCSPAFMSATISVLRAQLKEARN